MIDCEDFLYLIDQEINRMAARKGGHVYLGTMQNREDIRSAGMFGLSFAYANFDEWKEDKKGLERDLFESYARLCVRGEIKGELRARYPLGRISWSRFQKMSSYAGGQKEAFNIDWDKHADKVGLSPKKAKQTLRAFRCGFTESIVYECSYESPASKAFNRIEIADLIEAAGLTNKEKKVVSAHIFKDMEPKEAAKALGMSQSSAWRALKHACIRLYCFCIERGVLLVGMNGRKPPEGYSGLSKGLQTRLEVIRGTSQ